MPVDFFNPYVYFMRLRRIAYRRGWLRSQSAGIPVISVGNLTLGGSGKSPMVLLVAEYLERKGKNVSIVSRGYKRHSKGFVLVRNRKEILVSVEESGDEAQMIAELLPNAIVIVDEDRVRGARKAKSLGTDVIILDDGFQHLRLKRDMDILLTNGTPSPVLPFGKSREPQSASRDASIIVLSDSNIALRTDDTPIIEMKSIPQKFVSFTGNTIPYSEIAGKNVLALSSIANPERFQSMLTDIGARITPFALPDHADYSTKIVKNIFEHALQSGLEFIVTTMKDAVKIKKYVDVSSIPIFILIHKLEFLRGEKSFYSAIDRIV